MVPVVYLTYYKMTRLIRLKSQLQPSGSTILFSRLSNHRAYTSKSSISEDDNRSPQRQSGGEEFSPRNPIPSNKARPTLRDGKQSPIADFEGNLKKDLPEEVKKHNEEVENRYDRPYNRVGDQGRFQKTWIKQ